MSARIPKPANEPIKGYTKGSSERTEIEAKIKELRGKVIEIPLIIGGKEVKTGNMGEVRIPHEHSHVLAKYHKAGEKEVKEAIESAIEARKKWSKLDFGSRASVFLRAATLLAGPYRALINATTVLGQSKNFFQAEIDAACELIDFLRFNAYFAQQISEEQPSSPEGFWNRLAYRPLEGFVYAITPFNFTAIGANLPSAPALMGNVAIWKPSDYAVYSNYHFMKILQEAGLPDGVINFIPGDPAMISDLAIAHKQFAGIHYTGSSAIFQHLWQKIGENIKNYKSYPRIVGETGGKDFVVAHPSADVDALAVALLRGAFEYAGQKCSAASRAYIPSEIWPQVKEKLVAHLKKVKMGNPEDTSVLVNAVIHEHSFNKCAKYIELAKSSAPTTEIIAGGKVDKSVGWFVEPTVVVSKDPRHPLMVEEIFGPILTIHVYDGSKFSEILKTCDESSDYALTGSIFANDRFAVEEALGALEESAGNFYINDKPTGAVVNQQPFGGSRLSGTNDKAGSHLNLLRWTSPRTIKETFAPPKDWTYPYMSQ